MRQPCRLTTAPSTAPAHHTPLHPPCPSSQHKADKALGWDGFDDEAPDEQITVVLHHMFHPDDLLTDLNLAAELEEDLNAECGKLGKVGGCACGTPRASLQWR
jgi:hypothetical protein